MKKKLLLALLLIPMLAFGQFRPSKSVAISVASGTTTVLVAKSTADISESIYVTGFVISADTIATTAQFKYGTGTTCGTGTINLTGAMRMCDECNIRYGGSSEMLFMIPPGNDFCITTATGAVTGVVTYSQRY